MSELTTHATDDGVTVSANGVVIADYRATGDVGPVNTPKPYLHPLRSLAGVEITGFAPDDHPWHHGLQFAFPRVGSHNLWGGGTFFDLERGYEVVADQGRIRHDSWGEISDDNGRAVINQAATWLGHNDEILLKEQRTLTFRASEEKWPALVIDFATSLANATEQPIALATPAQRGRADGGYGGLFLRLGENFSAEGIFGDHEEITESGAQSRTMVVRGRTGEGKPITLGLSYLPAGSPGAQKWLYRFEPFSAIGWAVSYDDGLELVTDGWLAFSHRLVVIDGHVEPSDVRSLL
ncbi:MAG: DUF6807 family protein [Microbacteriaceae bacterium]